MIMYPEADIPVVCVSLHASLDPELHIQMGQALKSLRDDSILILGSGYTFHNLPAFFNPTAKTMQAAHEFNSWLKRTITGSSTPDTTNGLPDVGTAGWTVERCWSQLEEWETSTPDARLVHPREEHLLPLLVVAGTMAKPASESPQEQPELPRLIFSDEDADHPVSGYLFP
jgi:4,5-DOPA dioxygenase extradiol